ncbi:MAG: hypothetical protein JOZ02_04960 [Acidobacteria bacterium]|nr:hypothetical protein [Acidobacteriota bacterium]
MKLPLLILLFAVLLLTSAAPTALAKESRARGCTVGGNAAPLSQWRWAPRARVTVYALRGQFSPKESERLAASVRKWDLALRQSLSGIRLKPGGETDARVPRAGEIIVIRDRVKVDGHQVGEFRSVLRDSRGYVTAAVIALDRSIDDPRNLSSLLSHELGHGFGLWDCETCAKQATVMNGFKFPGRNVAEAPSLCDVLQVGAAYEAPPPGLPAAQPPAAAASDTSGGGDATVGEAEGPEPPGAAEAVAGYLRAEAEAREELKGYTFTRDVLIQTVDEKGEVSGEYRRLSRLVFDDRGGRVERVISFPKPTLKNLNITPEDLADLSGLQPFGPDLGEAGRYQISYKGEVEEGGERLQVLRFRPAAADGWRAFRGEVFVRASDHRVVRVRGKSLPEGEQRFPAFETRRERVDGTHFFPTYTYADDLLVFPRTRVRMRMTVRYSDYRRFLGKVTVVEEGEPGREN